MEVKLLSPDVPEELRYREWRLYRNISGDWLRTSTDENLWGAPQVLETGSFRFEFRQRDAAAVQAVAARAEAIYQQLHAALGLAYQPESSPLVVQVQAENVGVGPARFGGRRVVLLSPALQRARLGAEDSAVLSEGLTKALTERVAAQAAARTPFDARWAIVYEATKRWLAREADPFRRGNRVDEIGALAYQMQLNRQPTLWQLHERRTVYYWQAGWTLTSAEVLVEYLLGEGRHTDPQGIFRAMAAHTRWDEFAQAAAGMSAAELEKAWHAYLLRQYQLR